MRMFDGGRARHLFSPHDWRLGWTALRHGGASPVPRGTVSNCWQSELPRVLARSVLSRASTGEGRLLVTRHVPLVTFEFSDDGERMTIHIICTACNGGSFELATAHLAVFCGGLSKICEAAGDDPTAARIVDLGSNDNRRAAEAAYTAWVSRRRAMEAESN